MRSKTEVNMYIDRSCQFCSIYLDTLKLSTSGKTWVFVSIFNRRLGLLAILVSWSSSSVEDIAGRVGCEVFGVSKSKYFWPVEEHVSSLLITVYRVILAVTKSVHSLSWHQLWFWSPGQSSLKKRTFVRIWIRHYSFSFRLLMVKIFKSEKKNKRKPTKINAN